MVSERMSYPMDCCHLNPDAKRFNSHLRLGLSSGLFSPDFPTKILYVLRLYSIRATCPEHLILNDFISRMIFGGKYKARSFCYLVSPLSCHFIPFRPKCLPQHSTPSAYVPSSMWDTRLYSHAKKTGKNCSSVCSDLSVFGQQTGRQKILHRMIVNIP
jgi:hypothetical protein